MGEKINRDTVVIHVEKANGMINGLYGAINQEFLLHQWPDVAFVNREEDTGDEGLRKAKLSYYPVDLVKNIKGFIMADTILCRQATVQDLQQVQALWQQCFDDTPSFVQWYFSRYYRAEHTLGIFDDTALAGVGADDSIYHWRAGQPAGLCLYVGVDTAPQARHKLAKN